MANDGSAAPRAAVLRPHTAWSKVALELVALRGRDVIGVRHLLEGARACLGTGPSAFVRTSVGVPPGEEVVIAEVEANAFVVHVPARARARCHLSGGLGRICVGPQRIVLERGDRTVVVLPGGIQVRAQQVPIETFARGKDGGRGSARWLAVAGAVYVAALVLCAVLAPPRPSLAAPALQRAVEGGVAGLPK